MTEVNEHDSIVASPISAERKQWQNANLNRATSGIPNSALWHVYSPFYTGRSSRNPSTAIEERINEVRGPETVPEVGEL